MFGYHLLDSFAWFWAFLRLAGTKVYIVNTLTGTSDSPGTR
jgi:hypothetical protein